MDYSLLMAIRKIEDEDQIEHGDEEAFKLRAKSYENYERIKSQYTKRMT